MGLPSATHSRPSSTGFLLWAALMVCFFLSSNRCCGFSTFGFEMHHRFSDRLKGIFDVGELPDKDSLKYYAAMVHRDREVHGRRLASTEDVDQTPLTFSNGNDSYSISSLGYLLYANVSVGTPSSSYLVALDTGSDLFWLPCDCISCVRGLKTTAGEAINFNIYNPNTSSTSEVISCNSSYCYQNQKCSATADQCLYQVKYLSNGTSTTGVLVEDVLHLITDNDQLKAVDAKIKFGCGRIQTGSFLDGAAPNGLFGLGMTNISVPSTLAREGVAANSFSMCFGPDGVGRIRFGDKGSSSNQSDTPFNLDNNSHPTYNISITGVNIGKSALDLKFNAVFDSGTSFTYLNDPAYTQITHSFNSDVQEKRYSSDSEIPFEYCYEISQNQSSIQLPDMNLTMQGGSQFYVNSPIEIIHLVDYSMYIYCLAIVKSGNINIIGQNFMTGYQIVFNNEKMALGWKASNCYDLDDSTTLPLDPRNSSAAPPSVSFNPEETSGNRNSSQAPGTSSPPPPPMSNRSWISSPLSYTVMMLIMILFPSLVVF